MSDYAYRHGEGWGANRTTGGDPDNFSHLWPEIESLTLNTATSRITHISKRQPVAAKDLDIPYMLDGTGEMVISSYTAQMLRDAWFGTSGNIAGGSFVAANAIFPTVAVGDIRQIPGARVGISALTIIDSTGSPITLTLGLHYEIVDASAGLVKFLNITSGSVVQPFKAVGTEAPGSGVGFYMARTLELHGRFKMLNIAKSDAVEIFELYKMQFDPTTSYNILGDGSNVSSFTLPFSMLKDDTKSDSATFGKYGRIVQI